MKTCPRCRRNCLEEGNRDVMNSISHHDPKVKICSVCGQMEGLVKLGADVPKSEVLLTSEFIDYLASDKRREKS